MALCPVERQVNKSMHEWQNDTYSRDVIRMRPYNLPVSLLCTLAFNSGSHIYHGLWVLTIDPTHPNLLQSLEGMISERDGTLDNSPPRCHMNNNHLLLFHTEGSGFGIPLILQADCMWAQPQDLF